MKKKAVFIRQLFLALISLVLLSSFLTFSSINGAMAESIIEGEQQIDALPMGQAWITTYDGAGGYEDLAYVEFGQDYGFRTKLSSYIGHVVNTNAKSYLINWRPNVVGDSMWVCGMRVAYRLSDGAGGYQDLIYKHFPGSVLFPRDSGVEWASDWSGGCIYLESGDPGVGFNKNLNLPRDSRIDYLRVYYYRESRLYLPYIGR